MAFNDSFGSFGHFSFSSKPTHGRAIYESISENMGDSYDQGFESLNSARLYADAMCMASAQYQLDRALNNRNPALATELLTQLEKDFQVTPGYRDSLKQRRDYLSALAKVSRGNSQAVIENALRLVLGTDFVSYTHLTTPPWPVDPTATSVFAVAGETTKQFMIQPCVVDTGSLISVNFVPVGASEPPRKGEHYTVDPDPLSTVEVIKIDSSTATSISAVFSRSHDPGTIATRSYPFWSSHRRYSVITTTLAASQDPEKRRKVNNLMTRAARGVSQWCIVSNSGSFVLDSTTRGVLGSTALA